MRVCTLDVECFYDRKAKFSLSCMTTEEFVRDPRFELYGAAIKWGNEKSFWLDEPQLRSFCKTVDWSQVFMLNHHAHWDALVMSHHYGVVPKMIGCTLSQGRLMLGNHISVSLDSIRSIFGLPPKITPYGSMEGRHWHELPPHVKAQVAAGSCDEVDSILMIFNRFMAQGFPVEELETIDSTVKMHTDPVLIGDGQVFASVWRSEQVRRQQTFARLGLDPADLQSADRFAELLRQHGIEPEKKPGKPNADGSEKLIYAFAKTDPFMESLQLDEDEDVRALAEARLGAKSTLIGTRAETLGWMASRGPLCVYLNYCGAHTTRWSGGGDTNFQNWTNGSDINKGVLAPEGWLIVEPDSSQIECRLLNFVAGQWDKIEEFRKGKDPYIGNASAFYRRPINKIDHPMERQLGKIVELQAGFQSGGEAIRRTVRVKSGGKIILTPEEGVQARDAYRQTHRAVVALWEEAALNLKRMDSFLTFDWGPMLVKCDIDKGTRRIVLPNGCELIYDSLCWHADEETGERYWRIKTRKGWTKIYGGKLVENCIQALARVVISQAMIRLKHLGYRTVNTKHDSLWLLVPDDGRLEEHKAVILREMSRELPWLPGCPLAAEFKHIGRRYA